MKQLDCEHDFLLDCSFRLSEMYQRPESSIMVIVTSEVQMFLGGSADPAYHVTVTALSAEIAPTKNKRSTHLIQEFMYDTLHIAPHRGVVRFEAVPDYSLAINGVTAQQEIEELEEAQHGEENGVLRAISRQSRRAKHSTIPIFTERGRVSSPHRRAATPMRNSETTQETNGSRSSATSGLDKKKLKHRKSFLDFFKKTGASLF